MSPIPRLVSSKTASAILVVAAGLCAYSWTLGLPFRADDPAEIARAPERLSWSAGAEAPDVIIFRPVLWVVIAGERALFDEPLGAPPFHATSLLLHLLCSLVVLALGRRFFGSGSGLLAGIFFAVHPGGAQAVTWIAARGDLLATLFGGLAVLVVRPAANAAGWRSALGGGLCLALALASKIAAITFPALVVLLILIDGTRGSAARRLTHAALAMLPVILVYAWRWSWLGTPALSYYDGPATELPWPDLARNLPRMLGRLLVPWNETAFAAGAEAVASRPWRGAGLSGQPGTASLLAVIIVALLPWSDRPERRRVAFALIALLVVSAPALYLFSRAWALPLEFPSNREMSPDANAMNRALYPVMAVVAALVGAAFGSGGVRRSGRVRVLRLGGLVLLALLTVDAAVHHARLELRAARCVERRLAVVEEALESRSEPVHVAVVDWHVWRAGHPFLGTGLVDLFRPPFRDAAASVSLVRDHPRLLESKVLETTSRAVAYRELDAAGEVIREAALPALVEELPELVPVDTKSRRRVAWRPERPVPLRQLRGVRLQLERPLSRLDLDLVAVGHRVSHRVDARSAPATRFVLFDPSLEWLLGGSLERVGLSSNRSMSRAPRLVARRPEWTMHKPVSGTHLSIGQPLEVVVGDPPSPGRVVATLRGHYGRSRIQLVMAAPTSRLEPLSPGRHRLRFRPEDHVRALPPELSWATLPHLFEAVLKPRGIERFDVELILETTSPRGINVEGRTPPRVVSLGR